LESQNVLGSVDISVPRYASITPLGAITAPAVKDFVDPGWFSKNIASGFLVILTRPGFHVGKPLKRNVTDNRGLVFPNVTKHHVRTILKLALDVLLGTGEPSFDGCSLGATPISVSHDYEPATRGDHVANLGNGLLLEHVAHETHPPVPSLSSVKEELANDRQVGCNKRLQPF
jgi:hypothetical protein